VRKEHSNAEEYIIIFMNNISEK